MHRSHRSTYQLAVIANDFQVPFHDPKALLLFRLFLRRERPDWLILDGDFQDFWEISSYDHTLRMGKEFKDEIDIGRRILRSFRRSLPHARITWIEGNHEFRLRKYLIQNARELYGLPGLSIPNIFDLKRLDIEYVPCRELASNFTTRSETLRGRLGFTRVLIRKESRIGKGRFEGHNPLCREP